MAVGDRAVEVTDPPAVRLRHVSKRFGEGPHAVVALEDVSLEVQAGEFVCIVGASGCGKSTLLNLVAKLDTSSAGEVEVPHRRPALMFQESALFPWLTAAQNVELALRLRGVPRRERRIQAKELLSTVHLVGFEDSRPHELSGGMRQRVALARALAQDARLLLMDEPFGSVDAITRDLLHDELEAVWRANGLAILFVTHNVREAVRLGDRVLLFSSRPGRVVASFDIAVDRRSRADSPELATRARTITDCLRTEVRRHGR